MGCVILSTAFAVGCSSPTSTPPATATFAAQSSPRASATPVRINESLSIAIPAGYRFSDQGFLDEDSGIRMYGIYAVTGELERPPDRYLLTLYPRGSPVPFGFGVSSVDEVLVNLTKDLSDNHYTIEDASVDSRPDGSIVRIRAMRSTSGELAQWFLLLRNDGVLIGRPRPVKWCKSLTSSSL
jgi:hypothetical protein